MGDEFDERVYSYVSFDDHGSLVIEENDITKKGVSIILRTRFGFDLRVVMLFAFIVVIPYDLVGASVLGWEIFLNVKSWYEIAIVFIFFPLIAWLYQHLMRTISTIIDITGAKEPGVTYTLRDLVLDDESYHKLRNKIFRTLYGKGRYTWYGVLGGLGGFLVSISVYLPWGLHYYSVYGDFFMAFTHGWWTGIPVHPVFYIVPPTIIVIWFLCGTFVFSLFLRLLSLMNIIYNIDQEYALRIDKLVSGKPCSLSINQDLIGSYLRTWEIGNSIAAVFYKFMLLITGGGLLLFAWGLITETFAPEMVPYYGGLLVVSNVVPSLAFGIAFLGLLLPLLGFRKLLSSVKENIFLAANFKLESAIATALNPSATTDDYNEVTALREVIEAILVLPVWPLSTHWVVRIATLGSFSAAVSIIDALNPF